MTLLTFKTQIQRLMSKYGERKFPAAMLNQVWQTIGSYPDSYLIGIVDDLLHSKPYHGSKFSLADFTKQSSEAPPGLSVKPQDDIKRKVPL